MEEMETPAAVKQVEEECEEKIMVVEVVVTEAGITPKRME